MTAREEERRRLRRDLHDGLGPRLAGQTLKLEAAREALDDAPATTRALLDETLGESQALLAVGAIDAITPALLNAASSRPNAATVWSTMPAT
jgi:signal transduction histidine kinase